MIPTSSNYPSSLDSDTNLYLVHDSLRASLLEDYNPGDTSISITGDSTVIAKFPPTGLITLTEQCSDLDERAISFFYGSRTDTTFDELELLPDFVDVVKPKEITNITQNVMSQHHNTLKDALIAIEEFLGIKGTVDVRPFGPTLEGRLNFLRKLILSPKAWFKANRQIGIIPLQVQFEDQSFRNPTHIEWDFGDGTSPVSTVVSTVVPSGISSPIIDSDGGTIIKTYTVPGIYDVTLTVSNEFGEDTITFPNFIIARVQAPEEASIIINPSKAKINTLINIQVADNGEQPEDLITDYDWDLEDDLTHLNADQTYASYSIGGIYDVKLRVDTTLGAYRITTVPDSINIVESTNLWLSTFDSPASNTNITKILSTYEFGLISETFKSATMPLTVTRDDSFIDGTYSNAAYQKHLFRNNNSFAPRSTTNSGSKGRALVYWAQDFDTIKFRDFRPFDEIWGTPSIGGGSDVLTRNWNWLALNTATDANIIFGNDTVAPLVSDVNQTKNKINLSSLSVNTSAFTGGNYLNGADELTTNPDSYPTTYKGVWHISNGFILRNEAGPGSFYRLRNFYKTENVFSELVQNFRKLNDIPGSTKLEGELASLSSGVFFFNNTGEVVVYNTTSNTWSTASAGVGSASFRALQDSSVSGSGDDDQPLKIAFDRDRRVYLSFEYSSKAFIKFNETELTFTSLINRPEGEQFTMAVY